MRNIFTALLVIAPLLLSVGCTAVAESRSAVEENRNLIMAYVEAELGRDYGRLDDLLASDFTRHSSSVSAPVITSRDDFKAFLQETAAMFPDYENTIEKLIVDEEGAAAYATFSGTFASNGERVEFPFMAFWRIADGRIAELRVEWNDLVMMPQMGLLPPVEELMTPPLAAADILGTWKMDGWPVHIQYNDDGTYRIDLSLEGLNSDQPADSGVYKIENDIQFLRSGMDTQKCQVNDITADKLKLTGEGTLIMTGVMDTCEWRNGTPQGAAVSFTRIDNE